MNGVEYIFPASKAQTVLFPVMIGIGFGLIVTLRGVAVVEQPEAVVVSTRETIPVPAAFQVTVMELVPLPAVMLPPLTDHE